LYYLVLAQQAELAERIEGVWGKDRNGIYFFEQRIEGVDITTWQPLT
jgi:hypothetical protein